MSFIASVLRPFKPSPQQSNQGETVLVAGIRSKHTYDIASELVRSGAHVNAIDPNGSALMWAAREGDVQTVRLLLDKGANVDTTGPGGATAVDAAMLAHSPDIVKLLRNRGAQ